MKEQGEKKILDQYGNPIRSKKKEEKRINVFPRIRSRVTLLLAFASALALFVSNLESIGDYLYAIYKPIEIVEFKMVDSSIDLTIINNKSKPVLLKNAIIEGVNYPVESMTLTYKELLLPTDIYNYNLPQNHGDFKGELELMYNLPPGRLSRFKIHFVDGGDVNMFSEFRILMRSTLFRDTSIEDLLVHRGQRIKDGKCNHDPSDIINEVKPDARKNNLNLMAMLSEKSLKMEKSTREMIASNINKGQSD